MKTFRETLRDSFDDLLAEHSNAFIIGQGVTEENAIFGTMAGLYQKYGAKRVIEAPLAENMLTGLTLGAALEGMIPILNHYRADFSLLGADQIINHIAKWNFMFQKEYGLPIIIRMIVGRGWGTGPQHSSNLLDFFGSVPNLNVYVPATCIDIGKLLKHAIASKTPTIFLDFKESYDDIEIGDVHEPVKNKHNICALGPMYKKAILAKKLLGRKDIHIYKKWWPGFPTKRCYYLNLYPKGGAPSSHYLEANHYKDSPEQLAEYLTKHLGAGET